MVLYSIMPVVFVLAILAVAFEDKIKINKAAIAVFSAITLWCMLLFGADSILGHGLSSEFNNFMNSDKTLLGLPKMEQYTRFLADYALIDHLGDVSTTLFFVISSMLIVEIIDSHGGFKIITDNINTRSKRKFLWIICFITFFLSAFLDNLATGILMVAILKKFIPHRKERWIYSSMIIISANAGGSWSPIGDVTTILLWTSGNLTPLHQISHIFIPALMTMMVPLIFTFRFIKKEDRWKSKPEKTKSESKTTMIVSKRSRYIILSIGVLSLALVPVFHELTSLPPFMGVLFGLSLLWIYTDLMYKRINFDNEHHHSIANLFPKIDMPTIMFFFGILMSVAALSTAGQLQSASNFLDTKIHNPQLISFLMGIVSSMVDNVALVAGAIGMYPIVDASAITDPYMANFVTDGEFWTFLAYCCVTGGSILIIGSATGVAIMGIEKIDFMYYLKNFTLLALTGYIAGAGTYILLT